MNYLSKGVSFEEHQSDPMGGLGTGEPGAMFQVGGKYPPGTTEFGKKEFDKAHAPAKSAPAPGPKPGEPGTSEWKQAGSPRISGRYDDTTGKTSPEGPSVPVGTDLSKNYYPESSSMYKGSLQPADASKPMYPPGSSQNDRAGSPKATATGEPLPTNTSLPGTVEKDPGLMTKYKVGGGN